MCSFNLKSKINDLALDPLVWHPSVSYSEGTRRRCSDITLRPRGGWIVGATGKEGGGGSATAPRTGSFSSPEL